MKKIICRSKTSEETFGRIKKCNPFSMSDRIDLTNFYWKNPLSEFRYSKKKNSANPSKPSKWFLRRKNFAFSKKIHWDFLQVRHKRNLFLKRWVVPLNIWAFYFGRFLWDSFEKEQKKFQLFKKSGLFIYSKQILGSFIWSKSGNFFISL